MAERVDFCFDRYLDPDGFDPEALPDPIDLRRASHDELAMAWGPWLGDLHTVSPFH